jgi:hypothetical protein
MIYALEGDKAVKRKSSTLYHYDHFQLLTQWYQVIYVQQKWLKMKMVKLHKFKYLNFYIECLYEPS